MNNLLSNKNAVITINNSSFAMGAAIARRFAEEGANVAFIKVISDVDICTENMPIEYVEKVKKSPFYNTDMTELVTELEKQGAKVKVYEVEYWRKYAALQRNENITIYNQFEEDADTVIKTIISDLGSVDILVNNASSAAGDFIFKNSTTEFREIFDVTLSLAYNLVKACAVPMIKQSCGSVVNVVGIWGEHGWARMSLQSMAQSGLVGLTKTIAKELGSKNVRSNAVMFGMIDADDLDDAIRESYIKQIPMRQFVTEDDIANACTFLASDMAAKITGQVLEVDGGMNI